MVPRILHSLGDKTCAKCAEAGQWQEAAPAGELEPVCERITILSGLADNSAKQVVKDFEATPDLEFRDVLSSETEHDGGPATD